MCFSTGGKVVGASSSVGAPLPAKHGAPAEGRPYKKYPDARMRSFYGAEAIMSHTRHRNNFAKEY